MKMKGWGREGSLGRGMAKAREALSQDSTLAAAGDFDVERDLPKWKPEGLSNAQLAALARLKPEFRDIVQAKAGPNHLFNSFPENYSIEDHRGQFSFTWMLWAADNIQIFPELRKKIVPGLGKTYSSLVYEKIRQSTRPDRNEPPFELNLARYYKAFLELCPEKRKEILSSLQGSELHLSVETYLNGEYEEHTSQFDLEPKSGWVQGFAAAKVLFPDLAPRIDEFFTPHWAEIKDRIKQMKATGPEPEYVLAVAILGADAAWIDEQGEFHIELNRKRAFKSAKSLPERPIL